jgi:predicted RNase H-like HicB family nuclease
MPSATPPVTVLVDFEGAYGSRSSRDDVLRMLKEALALVENTPQSTPVMCSALRIEAVVEDGPSSDKPG